MIIITNVLIIVMEESANVLDSRPMYCRVGQCTAESVNVQKNRPMYIERKCRDFEIKKVTGSLQWTVKQCAQVITK